jgi:predicted DNA-binding WGR domain protein
MNRCAAIDSKNALDGIRPTGETRPMDETRSSHFERRDATRNMQRFYRLTVTRDLFGTVLLVREWGRIGVYARERREAKKNLAAACRDADRLAVQKQRRGYRLIEADGGR